MIRDTLLGGVGFLRRLTPARLRPRIRELLFAWLKLEWTYSTGVQIHIGNYGDWMIFCEIFAAGEYDHALGLAFDRAAASGRIPHVVDLGASTGFFTLRVLHEARRRRMPVTVTAIEALPATAERFRARMAAQSIPTGDVRLVQGLAGARAGVVPFYEDTKHAPSSTQVRRDAGRPHPITRLTYVDLSEILRDAPFIDLLKCDIEGSEGLVLENYADVLAKVDVAVFEFHRDLCDVARCQERLRSYGFTHEATFRRGAVNFTYGVWR